MNLRIDGVVMLLFVKKFRIVRTICSFSLVVKKLECLLESYNFEILIIIL
jgi:hypothetical protein